MNAYQKSTQGLQNVGSTIRKNIGAGQKSTNSQRADYSINPLKGAGKAFALAFAPAKKMTPDALAKRKRVTISNAAGRSMGGLYSK